MYKLELTEIEIACGVTLEQVQDLILKVLVREGVGVIFPVDVAPALAGAVARCALAGAAEYSGHNQFGQAIYRQSR